METWKKVALVVLLIPVVLLGIGALFGDNIRQAFGVTGTLRQPASAASPSASGR